MNSITINGVNKALEASEWCKSQGFNWELDLMLFSDNPAYTFKFSDSTTASLFALRWL